MADSSLAWRSVSADFGDANAAMSNASSNLSHAGTIFEGLRKNMQDQAQREADNQYRERVFAQNALEFDRQQTEAERAARAREAHNENVLAETARHNRAAEANAARSTSIAASNAARQEAMWRQQQAQNRALAEVFTKRMSEEASVRQNIAAMGEVGNQLGNDYNRVNTALTKASADLKATQDKYGNLPTQEFKAGMKISEQDLSRYQNMYPDANIVDRSNPLFSFGFGRGNAEYTLTQAQADTLNRSTASARNNFSRLNNVVNNLTQTKVGLEQNAQTTTKSYNDSVTRLAQLNDPRIISNEVGAAIASTGGNPYTDPSYVAMLNQAQLRDQKTKESQQEYRKTLNETTKTIDDNVTTAINNISEASGINAVDPQLMALRSSMKGAAEMLMRDFGFTAQEAAQTVRDFASYKDNFFGLTNNLDSVLDLYSTVYLDGSINPSNALVRYAQNKKKSR